jgi:hypothetical protein
MVCPQIVSTDLDDLWLLCEWHEVKLQYTVVSNFGMPLSMIGIAPGKPWPACDGVGYGLFQSSSQKVTPGANPLTFDKQRAFD